MFVIYNAVVGDIERIEASTCILPEFGNIIKFLYIDLRPGQTCHSKTAEVAYSIGVGEFGWQYGTGLKSHGTVTNGFTGRDWPMNYMTVISAWWRSNMPFQRRRKCIFRWPVMGRYWVGVNNYITQCTENLMSLGIRQVGDKMR